MAPRTDTSVIIDAPPAQIGDILADFDHWKDWNTWFTEIHAHDPDVNVGTPVTFTSAPSETAKPGTYTVRIFTWEPEREISWKGGPMPASLGWVMQGYHWFRLVPQDGGKKTMFEHGEQIEGILNILVTKGIMDGLKGQAEKFNKELKKRVEGGKSA